MDPDTGNWEAESEEDFQLIERKWNPLAELFAELVLCFEAAQSGIGALCSACTCPLQYHLSCDDGACENCGCEDIHKFCEVCGTSRSLERYEVGSKVCKYCQAIPPIRIKPLKQPEYRYSERGQFNQTALEETFSRSTEARKALKELSE